MDGNCLLKRTQANRVICPGVSSTLKQTARKLWKSAAHSGRQCSILTWQKLILWLACLHGGAHKGNPHVLGSHIVLVGAAEDIDVRAAVHLQGTGAIAGN